MLRKAFHVVGLPVLVTGCAVAGGCGCLESVFHWHVGIWQALGGMIVGTTLIAVVAAARVIHPLGTLPALVRVAAMNGATGVAGPQSSQCQTLPREVQDILNEIDQALDQVRRDTRARTDFVANMSHELRTPLNSIIGFAEVLREPVFGELSGEQQSYVDDILASGRHLLSLINDILDLSKIESGHMELNAEQVDLSQIVSGSLRMFREKALRHSIALSAVTDDSPRFIEADERKLKQILFNLLSNALKFTPDGGEVSVQTLHCGETVRIIVSDTGDGLTSEQQQQVFERFYQVEPVDGRQHEGTGLGLPLVRQIAELHSGRVWCESEPETGSRFIVEIPIEQSVEQRQIIHSESTTESFASC